MHISLWLEKLTVQRQLGRPKHRQGNNTEIDVEKSVKVYTHLELSTEIDLQGTDCEIVQWIYPGTSDVRL